MQRLLFAAVFLLAGCGPTNVNIPPGAVVINADTTQQQATPTPTAVAQASPTPSPSPTPTPKCPPHSVYTAGANVCTGTIRQSPVTTEGAAQTACAVFSARVCSVAELAAYCPTQNEYVLTSQTSAVGQPTLFYEDPSGQYFTAVLGNPVGPVPGQPGANPFFCCSDPLSN